VTFTAYLLAGIIAALAGMLLSARIYSGDALIGGSYVLDAITAAVIGGTSLLGGVGSVLGTLAGASILVLSNNMLNLFHVSAYFQYVTKGLILFAALVISFVGESRKRHGK
jgi:ribose transport system permease protein